MKIEVGEGGRHGAFVGFFVFVLHVTLLSLVASRLLSRKVKSRAELETGGSSVQAKTISV